MPKARVKYAQVRYVDKGGMHVIPRGVEHDFPQEVYDRHVELGSFFQEGEEPTPVGSLIGPDGDPGITADASDEELDAWTLSATVSELATLRATAAIQGNDEFLDRIDRSIESIIDNRTSEVESRLAQVQAMNEGDENFGINAGGETTVNPATDAVGGVVTQDHTTVPMAATLGQDTTDPDGGGGDDLDDLGDVDDEVQDPDFVVSFSVPKVSMYLSKHPEEAQAVLEAENRRVEATGEDPRTGVIRAVQAVAGHSGG